MKQAVLITCELNNTGTPTFQVQNQGVLFLRSFSNKKLRIVLNVGHSKQKIRSINQNFAKETIIPSNNQLNSSSFQHNNQYLASVEISPITKILSQNRVLLILNIFYNKNPITEEGSSPSYNEIMKSVGLLLIYGYYVTSLYLYHFDGDFSIQGDFIEIMAAMQQQMKQIKINEFQQYIKYEKASKKEPFLMCLTESACDNFREFYKYNEEYSKQWNLAIDTLLDYFPKRSAIDIRDEKMVGKLCSELQQDLLDRKVFNYENTGLMLQNLSFQFCQAFNQLYISPNIHKQPLKSSISFKSDRNCINLIEIFEKVKINQKTRIKDIATQMYHELLQNARTRKLPQPSLALSQLHEQIRQQVINEIIEYAVNCMEFTQFYPIYFDLLQMMGSNNALSSIIENKYQQVVDENLQKQQDRIDTCYRSLECTQQELEELQNMNSENIREILMNICDKICTFIKQTTHETPPQVFRFIEEYFQNLTDPLLTHFNQENQYQSEKQALIQENRELKMENKNLERKYTIMENRLSQLLQENLRMKENEGCLIPSRKYLSQPQNIKKGSINEIKQKDIEINNLRQKIQRLSIDPQNRLNKPLPNILKQSTECIQTIKKMEQHLNNLLQNREQFYQQVLEQFQTIKNQILGERTFLERELLEKNGQLQLNAKIIQEYSEMIVVQKESMKIQEVHLKKLEKQYEKLLIEKAKNYGDLQEANSELMEYRKVLDLMTEGKRNGNYSQLTNYGKVTKQEYLKQQIKKFFSK